MISASNLDPDPWSEISSFVSPIPSCELDERGFIDNGEFIYLSSKENWVAKEMWQHIRSKGLSPEDICNRKAKSDLIEI